MWPHSLERKKYKEHLISIIGEVLSRRKHAAAKQFLAAAVADLLRPVHPTVLAQAISNKQATGGTADSWTSSPFVGDVFRYPLPTFLW